MEIIIIKRRLKMQKINNKVFDFQFFLSNKKKVTDLEQSAKQYGGATKNLFTDELYSNIESNDYITINKTRNTISLFVPDTYNINQKADQQLIGKIITYCATKIKNRYGFIPFAEKAIGSWYSSDLQQVIYDNIILLVTHHDNISITDINFFISLANYIKQEMKQEGVSIGINEALAII
jgi:hypothetical protein